jgi:hypothetical protein
MKVDLPHATDGHSTSQPNKRGNGDSMLAKSQNPEDTRKFFRKWICLLSAASMPVMIFLLHTGNFVKFFGNSDAEPPSGLTTPYLDPGLAVTQQSGDSVRDISEDIRLSFRSPSFPSATTHQRKPSEFFENAPTGRTYSYPDAFSFEPKLGDDSGISIEQMNNFLDHAELPQSIDRFATESLADPDAAMLSRIFRSTIERTITENENRLSLSGFACGIQICIGTMAGGDPLDYIAWRNAFALAPELSGIDVFAATLSEPNGASLMRFGFSVDPARQPTSP